jgi:hypothetical protein
VATTGLAQNQAEYRRRLNEQTDEQLDSWAGALMRDVAIRRGVIKVLTDFRTATRLDDNGVRRVFARGGGAPATVGLDAQGRLMVPAISLHFLVPGVRADMPDARARIVDYLVCNFDEIVYI